MNNQCTIVSGDSLEINNNEEVKTIERDCVFCHKSLETADTVKLTKKGCDTINKANDIKVTIGQVVHQHCRLLHYKKSLITNKKQPVTAAPTNVDTNESICLFCGNPARSSHKAGKGNDVSEVKTQQFEETLLKHIDERQDEWAREVKSRISTRSMLGSLYHKKCDSKFRQKISKLSVGRPQNECRQEAFSKVVEFMNENEGDAFTINDLVDVMKSKCGENVEEYCGKFLKKKLIDHFGDNICFLQSKGRPDYIIFRHSANSIISEFRKTNHITTEEHKKNVLETAGKLILSDISSMNFNKSEYPSAESISCMDENIDFVPDSLLVILKSIIKTKNADLKIASIGQSVVQAACPRRVIAPLQIGLGVLMHHLTGSKFVIQTLNRFGFCSSYDEVQRFELCASIAEDNVDRKVLADHMVKFVADNIDHDTRTIDGKNTFHAMGIISAHTPAIIHNRTIKRSKPRIEDIRAKGSVQIHQYLGEATDKCVTFKDISSLLKVKSIAPMDMLSNITWNPKSDRPFWSGLMQSVYAGDHPGKSSLTILPIIDLNPSDLDCVYSTLMFLEAEARTYGTAAIVTFDQPLWWKAHLIIQNEPESSPLKNIILLLGGFHTQMSFLGTIGKLCEGLGLQEILETVYAANSVPHIMSGKAYSRAIRGYFMIDQALNHLLMEELTPQKMSESEWKTSMVEAEDLFSALMAKRLTVSDIESNEVLASIEEEITLFKDAIGSKSRTAKFWLQFMEMVSILKTNIRSERIGNWQMQIGSLGNMLPFFPSAGHNSYAKSTYIHLHEMSKLESNHPAVYERFTRGHFIIRRSDRYWSGLACDLTIEQFLMKNIKSQIGLTRGRGIGENQRLIWINSMADCVNVKNAIQELTGLQYETSEQHKEVGVSRQKRDLQDTGIIIDYLRDRHPFKLNEGAALRNIHNGMEAHKTVNVDQAKSIGEKILASMKDQKAADFTFKKVSQAITMHSRNTIAIDGEPVTIDPQLLFQRLILLVGNMNEGELRDVFKYELSHRPSSIFDEHGFMRNGDTSSLDNALLKVAGTEDFDMCKFTGRQILSGDYLINKVNWKKNSTYDAILSDYVTYVRQCNDPVIIFSMFASESSILDEFYLRTSKCVRGVKIAFTGSMTCSSKKESVLINEHNKQRFTDMLCDKLVEHGYDVLKANHDLNVTIAETAMNFAATTETLVISDDSELLYVLCNHFKTGSKNVFFKYDGRGAKKQSLWSMERIETALGEERMRQLVFVNAISGSKTTSHLFGVGKGVALKKLLNVNDFQAIASVFGNSKSTIPDVVEAGNRAIVMLYNGKPGQSLNELRYNRFADKVLTSKSCIDVQSLPPTESAVYHHSLRVYLQTQIWMGNENLDAEQYGWKVVNHKLVPKTTDLGIAPQKLLSSIKCGCKGDCATNRCNCKRNKLLCSVACTHCRGSCCLNPSEIIDDDFDDFTY